MIKRMFDLAHDTSLDMQAATEADPACSKKNAAQSADHRTALLAGD